MSVAKEISCGAFAGTLGVSAVYPLDTVKTRLQAGMFSTMHDCVTSTWRKERVMVASLQFRLDSF